MKLEYNIYRLVVQENYHILYNIEHVKLQVWKFCWNYYSMWRLFKRITQKLLMTLQCGSM